MIPSATFSTITAGDVGRFKGGNGFPLRYQGSREGVFPFFKVSDMNNPGNEVFMRQAKHYVSESQRKRIGATWFPMGAIVFAKVGAAVFLERKRILAQDSCIDNNMAALIVHPGVADAQYVYYQMCNFKMSSLVATTALPSLNGPQLRKLPIRLPPTLAEQQRIAQTLYDIDDFIDALKRLIAKKEAIKQGVAQELLSGKIRLQGFAGAWEEWSMGSLGATYGGLAGKTKEDFGIGSAQYVPFMAVIAGVRVTTQSLLRVRVVKGERQNAVMTGDLLFNTSSETPDELAMCAVAGDLPLNVYLNSFCFGFRLSAADNADPLFLAYMFRDGIGRRLMNMFAQGATRYNLAKSQFRSIVLTLPSVDEQRAIAGVLADIDSHIGALREYLAKSKAIKQGMMRELLTGSTRLPITEEIAA